MPALFLFPAQTKARQTPVQNLAVLNKHPPPFLEHPLSSTCKFAFLFSKSSSKKLDIEGDSSSTTFLTDFALANWRSKFFVRAKITKRTRICFILIVAVKQKSTGHMVVFVCRGIAVKMSILPDQHSC